MSDVSVQTIKVLYGQARSCAFPYCGQRLVFVDDERDVATPVGEVAHIRSPRPSGPRHDPGYPKKKVHEPGNLLLLCGTHHHVVDDNASVYSIEELEEWKAAHVAGDGWQLTDHQAEMQAMRADAAWRGAAALEVMAADALDAYRSRNRPNLEWELRQSAAGGWEVIVTHYGPDTLDLITFELTSKPAAVESLTDLNIKRSPVLALAVSVPSVRVATAISVGLATVPKAGGKLVVRAACRRQGIEWDVAGLVDVPDLYPPAGATARDQLDNFHRPGRRRDV